MAEGARRENWAHTSTLLATIVNLVRDRKRNPRPIPPEKFNPMHRGPIRRVVEPGGMEALKAMFAKPNGN